MRRRIASFILISLVVLSGRSRADDNSSSDIMSLNYYPHKGMFALNPRVNTTLHDYTTASDNSQDTLYSNSFTLGAAYGLGSGWRVSLSETLLWDQNQNTIGPLGLVESEDSARGLSDPTAAVTWRFLENDHMGLSGDLGVTFMPNFGAHVVADGTVSREGNNLNGAAELTPAFALYWRNLHNELGFVYTLTHEFSGTNEANAASVRIDAYNVQTVTLRDRVHVSNGFFIEPSAFLTFGRQYNQTRTPGAEIGIQSPTFVNPQLYVGFLPDPSLSIILGAAQHRATTLSTNQRTGFQTAIENNYVMGNVALLHQF